MRLLVAIPHFFPRGSSNSVSSSIPARHGSGVVQSQSHRVSVLEKTITQLQQNFGSSQGMIQIADRSVIPVNRGLEASLQIVVVTNQADHLMSDITIDRRDVEHVIVKDFHQHLGFACQRILADRRATFDTLVYLEDDLWIHDSMLIAKTVWFTQMTSLENVLQPNRYECQRSGKLQKCYVDGDISLAATSAFQDVRETPFLDGQSIGQTIRFVRPLNPHSGCYFLSAEQMEHWSRQPDFAKPTDAFVGPLESAATLGIMKHFRVYKPAPLCASFAEIEHGDPRFIGQVV